MWNHNLPALLTAHLSKKESRQKVTGKSGEGDQKRKRVLIKWPLVVGRRKPVVF
jgi:hypothetical protein